MVKKPIGSPKRQDEKKSGRKEDGTTSRNAVILLKSLDLGMLKATH
jgi:hypothetical protein